MKRSSSVIILTTTTTTPPTSFARLLLFNFKHVNNNTHTHIRNYNNNTLNTSRINTTPTTPLSLPLFSQHHQPRIASTLHFNSHHNIPQQRYFSTSSTSNPPQEEEEKGGFFGGIFSSIASKIKKVVKGDKEQPQQPQAQPTSQSQSQAQASPNLSTEEKKDHEEEEARAEKDINEGLFTLETYRLELRKAKRVAKVKGYYDSIKDKINSALGKGEESEMKKQIEILEAQLALLEAMTPEERNDPTLITVYGFKRKTRIAQATNQTVEDVNRLIMGYNRAHDMVLIMTKAKKEGKEIPKDMEGIQRFLSENPSFLKKYAEKKGMRRR